MNSLIRLIIASILLVIAAGCACDCDKLYRHWFWEDAAGTRDFFTSHTNAIVVRIDESYWEDRGPHRYSLAHFKGTVVHSFQGNWQISQRIAYVKGLDYSLPPDKRPKPNQAAGDLLLLLTDEHTDREIPIDTDFVYDRKMKQLMECVFGSPRK